MLIVFVSSTRDASKKMSSKRDDTSNKKCAETAMAAPKGGVQKGLSVKGKQLAARGRKTRCRGAAKKEKPAEGGETQAEKEASREPRRQADIRRRGHLRPQTGLAFFRYKRGKSLAPIRADGETAEKLKAASPAPEKRRRNAGAGKPGRTSGFSEKPRPGRPADRRGRASVRRRRAFALDSPSFPLQQRP
jgi:hypothetical protein